MKAVQISDWDLEDRLSIDHRPIVVQFMNSGDRDQKSARGEFKTLASAYPDSPFYEIDLLENPSAAKKYALNKRLFKSKAVTLVFVDGIEQIRHVGAVIGGAVARVLGPREEPDEEMSEDE